MLAYQVRAYATLARPLPNRHLGRYWQTPAAAVLSYPVTFVFVMGTFVVVGWPAGAPLPIKRSR